jgi:hypothetical protein
MQAQFRRIVISIFLYIILDLQQKESAPFERTWNFGEEKHGPFLFSFYLYLSMGVLLLKSMGKKTNQYAKRHAAQTNKLLRM